MPEGNRKLTQTSIREFIQNCREAGSLEAYFGGGRLFSGRKLEYIIFPADRTKPLLGLAAYELLDWDTRLLGIKVARMLFIATKKDCRRRGLVYGNLIKDLLKHCGSMGVKIIFFRDPVGGRLLVSALNKNGARPVSRTVNACLYFKKDTGIPDPNGIVVRKPKKHEFKAICMIMAKGYQNRLLREARLDKNRVRKLYYQWAMNDLSGRVSTSLVACWQGKIAGFIAFDRINFCREKYGFVDMVVVKNDLRKHGIGISLIKEAENRLKSGAKGIILNFESEHPGLKRFYSKAGFKIAATFNFYHLYP